MKRTPLKPFKRKEGIQYHFGTTIRVKSDTEPLKRTPLRKISKQQIKKIQSYREIAFKKRGTVCFLCGRQYERNSNGKVIGLDVHHLNENRRDNSIDNLIPLCNKYCGCKAHNHMGAEGLKELNQKILKKLNTITDTF